MVYTWISPSLKCLVSLMLATFNFICLNRAIYCLDEVFHLENMPSLVSTLTPRLNASERKQLP